MPSNKTRNTLARQWELLKLIPTRGSGKTSKELAVALNDLGYSVSKRQVERDLNDLEVVFSLDCNDASIPYGWRWSVTGSVDLPGITLAEALSLKVVEETLKPLLPASIQRALLPRFEQAQSKLSALGGRNPTALWSEKVSIVSPTLPLMPPKIGEDILEVIQTALLENQQVDVVYNGHNETLSEQRLHPLGLVLRGPVIYLVATAYKYSDIRLYALHRFQEVKSIYEKAIRPKGFKLSEYVASGALQFGNGKSIKFVANISIDLARILEETPLASDQQIKDVDGKTRMSATVPDSWQLRWWILSQAASIRVLKPIDLVTEILMELKNAVKHYK